jgi:PadR family transcriptional regulator PadR
MPRGFGRGRGRRRRVISFLQPCVLVMLHRGEAHGYNLMNGLDEFGFQPGRKDSLGPHRRVYQITPEGEAYLEDWIEDLRRTRREIDSLLLAYESVKADLD